jgi:monofunctional biosynthetic peptidoglycan transglycosylase
MARVGLRTVGEWIVASAAFGLVVLFAAYATLPDVRPLATRNPEMTAFMELRAREARARGQTPLRIQHWVSYTRISPHLRSAVLLAEDSAFWRHEGIDVEQLRESMELNFERMEFARGASTITQQLAKNLYLSPRKDPFRKFRELLLARDLEAALSKRRILELYLNVIEWGDGLFGAEAAAQAYFGVPASALSAQQSALLAGAIINPHLFNPAAPNRRLLARQRLILRKMYAAHPPDATASE